MQKYFPEIALQRDQADRAYFVYYDLVPVGLLLGRAEEGELRILLDTGAINGGTEAGQNPNDVNLPLDSVKVALICKRYVESMMSGKPPDGTT